MRDDGKLNYVVNRDRDDPIVARQGSRIEMTGPKRGIYVAHAVLIEYDVRIKSGEREEDDLQLIDGAFPCKYQRPWKPITNRITGECGAVDVSLAFVQDAVEATVEVEISKVQRGFDTAVSLSSFVYIWEDYEEIPLFHGAVDPSRGLRRRFVVAVTLGTKMLLKLKVGDSVERCCSFKAAPHGCAGEKMKLELASVSVKSTTAQRMSLHMPSATFIRVTAITTIPLLRPRAMSSG
ncbi:hypothetical protein EJB05_17133, partial [Eragrostis curvula]